MEKKEITLITTVKDLMLVVNSFVFGSYVLDEKYDLIYLDSPFCKEKYLFSKISHDVVNKDIKLFVTLVEKYLSILKVSIELLMQENDINGSHRQLELKIIEIRKELESQLKLLNSKK